MSPKRPTGSAPGFQPLPLQPTSQELSGASPLLGAHVSTAGGMQEAITRARNLGCTAMQVFVKNQQRWQARPLTESDDNAFAGAAEELMVIHSMAHASYLINLASPEDALRRKSQRSLLEELQRCARLGIRYLVLHPGAAVNSSEREGLQRIVAGLHWVLSHHKSGNVTILLESTAGQGSCLGHRFEHLSELLEATNAPEHLQICIDTCHVFAAGYDIRTSRQYEKVWEEFESTVGLRHLKAFHLNDSMKPLGSRVDRHAEIGLGHIGESFFGRLVRDERFRGLPMVLETPGGQDGYRRALGLLRTFLG